jgi:hypothetical protein
MTSQQESPPDPIDEQAAHIDARSEDAPERIEELIEHAEDLGRDAPQPVDSEGDPDAKGEGADEPEVLPG